MKTILMIAFLQLTSNCVGQKDLVGLFGKCDGTYSGYICQQVLFKGNSKFQFYDLLHLRGWTVSEGTWQKEADTIILNSLSCPYSISYIGKSNNDSVLLSFIIDNEPMPFGAVYISSTQYEIDSTGTIKCSKDSIRTIYNSFYDVYNGAIKLDWTKAITADTIEIKMPLGYKGKHYFENEKWLLKENKLFYLHKTDGSYDTGRRFERAKKRDLKYNKKNYR